MEEEEPEFETGEEFSLDMEEPETEEEPIPETEEEPEENFTRSGGRRASNLGRNREVASKEIPSGNKLAEGREKKEEDFWNEDKVYYYKDIAIQLYISDRGYKQYQILNNQEPFSIPEFSTLKAAKQYIDDNNLVSYKKQQESKLVKIKM